MEVMTFRVEALKVTDKPRLQLEAEGAADPSGARKGDRDIYLRQSGHVQAAVYEGERLAPGNVLNGPAIIERRDTTILIPPGHQARMDGYRNIRITVKA
jgi:N-methylhydantoinase A